MRTANVAMLESISRGKAVSFYQAHVYPHLVKILGDPKTIRQVRQRTVSLAHGTGPRNRSRCRRKLRSLRLNKPRKLYALEPNPGMIRLAARERDRLKLAVEFLECPGECIPLEGSQRRSDRLDLRVMYDCECGRHHARNWTRPKAWRRPHFL
jgi:hypothetical protein